MPLLEKRGDLFNSSDKYYAHGCNMHGVQGAGVAAIFKDKYPDAYKQYRSACLNKSLALGGCLFVNENDKVICSMLTQSTVGSGLQVCYNAIEMSYKQVMNHIINNNKTFDTNDGLSIPMIGAGLGGGDWNKIYNIIKDNTPDNINTTIWKL